MTVCDVSVIIPVYNVEKYLKKCIESVVNQKGVDYEIILVDDGSTDSSPQICDLYAEKYDNISVIHKENEGLGFARNSGLEKAKGEYIFFLDSDDWIVDNTINSLVLLAREYNVDLVCFQYIRTNNRDYISDSETETKIEVVDNFQLMENYFSNRLSSTACSKLYKKSLFDTVRFTNVRIHEDAYSMHLFLEQVEKAVITSEIYYIQYIRRGSLVQSKFNLNNLLCIECGDRMIQFAKEKYPGLVVNAHFNKLSRQVYTINLILKSYKFFKYRSVYYKIKREMPAEIDIVESVKELDRSTFITAKQITNFGFIYVLQYTVKDLIKRMRLAVFADKGRQR